MRRSVRITILLLALSILTSCVNNFNYSGLKVNEDDIKIIKKSKYDMGQVATLLGAPTLSSQLGNETWFYIYSVTNKVAFFKPELVDEEIVAIEFTKNGKFMSLAHYDKEAIMDLATVSDTTPTFGTKANPVQQILRNIQKYSVPNLSPRKKSGL